MEALLGRALGGPVNHGRSCSASWANLLVSYTTVNLADIQKAWAPALMDVFGVRVYKNLALPPSFTLARAAWSPSRACWWTSRPTPASSTSSPPT